MDFETVKEKWEKDGRLKILAALLLNILFLLVMLSCYTPRFETNDDVLMSKFVDGQMAEKTAYVPFINIVLGFFLKLCYSIGGDALPWYAASQYMLMLLGFTAMTWVLLRRFTLLPAMTMTGVILFTVGMNSYLYPTFSKVGAVATVGGLSMMLYGMRNESWVVKRRPVILGIALSVLGFFWRYEEFFAVAAIMVPIGLVALIEMARETKGAPNRLRLRGQWRYVRSFLLLLVIVLLLFGFNRFLWTRGDYAYFTDFSDTRSTLVDLGTVPEYEQMQDVYDSLDMDKNAVYFLKNWSFYDTEKFTLENIKTILDARNSLIQPPSLGECLGIFLDTAIPGLAQTLAFWTAVLMLMLWLACGKHRLLDWIGAGMSVGIFGLIYLMMIYQNRYLANRVDMGLLLASAMALTFLMDKAKFGNEKLFCVGVIALALLIGAYSNKNICLLSDQYDVEDKSSKKAAIEQLLEDEEHLYLCKVWSIDHELYTPLETAPAGFADKIVLLGGWSLYHPSIEHILEQYDIENPYPDMIDNEQVYLIDKDIERTLAYLKKYYDPQAEAELIEPLSRETGLQIYRILGSNS